MEADSLDVHPQKEHGTREEVTSTSNPPPRAVNRPTGFQNLMSSVTTSCKLRVVLQLMGVGWGVVWWWVAWRTPIFSFLILGRFSERSDQK